MTKEYVLNNTEFNLWSIKWDDRSCHIFLDHIGKTIEFLTKRAKKIGQDATSFFSDKEAEIAVEKLRNSEEFAEMVVELVNSNYTGRLKYNITCKTVEGNGVGVDGDVFETRRVRFYLSFKGKDYINRHTKMPFKVASFYPIREKN